MVVLSYFKWVMVCKLLDIELLLKFIVYNWGGMVLRSLSI